VDKRVQGALLGGPEQFHHPRAVHPQAGAACAIDASPRNSSTQISYFPRLRQ
jgi:hypothetical protein